ncbi:MAG: hypothetical protein IJV31_02575 [Clostridia bacterium]|nr:hypothetical protein [Clostridia bacterium]
MKCTGKEWDHCRVEKMGCFGCHYNENKIYIHYGARHFDKNLFQEIKNIPFVKPEGGLWASDVKAKYGWKQWTEDNCFMTDKYREDNCFKFKLKENAKILMLKSKKDLEKLPKYNVPTFNSKLFNWLDFEELKKQYDAIEILIDQLYWELYGWDCDSILILNKEIIEEVQ